MGSKAQSGWGNGRSGHRWRWCCWRGSLHSAISPWWWTSAAAAARRTLSYTQNASISFFMCSTKQSKTTQSYSQQHLLLADLWAACTKDIHFTQSTKQNIKSHKAIPSSACCLHTTYIHFTRRTKRNKRNSKTTQSYPSSICCSQTWAAHKIHPFHSEHETKQKVKSHQAIPSSTCCLQTSVLQVHPLSLTGQNRNHTQLLRVVPATHTNHTLQAESRTSIWFTAQNEKVAQTYFEH